MTQFPRNAAASAWRESRLIGNERADTSRPSSMRSQVLSTPWELSPPEKPLGTGNRRERSQAVRLGAGQRQEGALASSFPDAQN